MDSFKYKQVSEFCIEGRFHGFASNDAGKLKYLRVAVETSQLQIKISKELRGSIVRVLQPGDQIQVFGKKKRDKQTGQFKLKAFGVNKVALDSEQTVTPEKVSRTRPKAKILVCQKSTCRKRGGKKLLSGLEEAVCDRGLQDQVKIEGTGCLKRCSKAPSVVLMPGKTRLRGTKPEKIAAMLEKLR